MHDNALFDVYMTQMVTFQSLTGYFWTVMIIDIVISLTVICRGDWIASLTKDLLCSSHSNHLLYIFVCICIWPPHDIFMKCRLREFHSSFFFLQMFHWESLTNIIAIISAGVSLHTIPWIHPPHVIHSLLNPTMEND